MARYLKIDVRSSGDVFCVLFFCSKGRGTRLNLLVNLQINLFSACHRPALPLKKLEPYIHIFQSDKKGGCVIALRVYGCNWPVYNLAI